MINKNTDFYIFIIAQFLSDYIMINRLVANLNKNAH